MRFIQHRSPRWWVPYYLKRSSLSSRDFGIFSDPHHLSRADDAGNDEVADVARCLGRAVSPRSRLPIPSLRRTQQALRASGHAAGDTNAQHVYPPFVKIEQVGIEQRADEILNHDHQADP